MNESQLFNYTVRALVLVLTLSLPSVLVAAFFGILVSLIQAVTQVQDQTLTFAIKLIAVVITLVLTAYWSGDEIYHFSLVLFERFPEIVR